MSALALIIDTLQALAVGSTLAGIGLLGVVIAPWRRWYREARMWRQAAGKASERASIYERVIIASTCGEVAELTPTEAATVARRTHFLGGPPPLTGYLPGDTFTVFGRPVRVVDITNQGRRPC